jgi:ribose-phosphate pyrophosphokinase
MLLVAGVDHIITMDLHSSLITGFFNKPVDNLVGEPVIAKYITENFAANMSDAVIISKNAGGVKLYYSFTQCYFHGRSPES